MKIQNAETKFKTIKNTNKNTRARGGNYSD